MVRAAEELAGVAGRRAHDARALVRAAVHQHAHRAVVVADHDQRLAGDLDRDVVARVRQLASRGRRSSRCWRRSAPAPARTARGRCRGRGGRGRAGPARGSPRGRRGRRAGAVAAVLIGSRSPSGQRVALQRRAEAGAVLVGQRGVAQFAQGRRRERRAGAAARRPSRSRSCARRARACRCSP